MNWVRTILIKKKTLLLFTHHVYQQAATVAFLSANSKCIIEDFHSANSFSCSQANKHDGISNFGSVGVQFHYPSLSLCIKPLRFVVQYIQ